MILCSPTTVLKKWRDVLQIMKILDEREEKWAQEQKQVKREKIKQSIAKKKRLMTL